MPDSNIPIQPIVPPSAPGTPQPPTPPPFKIMTFTASDPAGNAVQIQAVSIVDEFGRPITPLTEATGNRIIHALSVIQKLLAEADGGLTPDDDSLSQG
jgi:hypothetical protein